MPLFTKNLNLNNDQNLNIHYQQLILFIHKNSRLPCLKMIKNNTCDCNWNYMFEKLSIYIKENNIQPHMYLKNLTEDVIKLRNWCQTQTYQKNNLAEKQLKKLESIYFVWDPRKTIWLQRFKEFKKYFLKNR